MRFLALGVEFHENRINCLTLNFPFGEKIREAFNQFGAPKFHRRSFESGNVTKF